ncbi:MAG: DNA-binding transcriptional regulator OxyR [Vulcanimicrobiaceae bacterium]
MIPSLSGLSLRDLEYAVAVGKELHFGRAAERCSVSQAALSEQIRKLESLLGVQLFERTKRHVEPTVRGAVLLAQAEQLLTDARHFLDEARRRAEPMTGELRVGVIATLGPYYLPALIREGREHFPKLALRLHESTTAPLLESLRRGEIDAALVALPVAIDGLHVEPLFFEPFAFACPSGHAMASNDDVHVRDLRRDELLLMEDGHCLRDQAIALCNVRNLSRHARVASSLEMLRHMIAAGEGCSVMPLLATQGRGGDRGLVTYRAIADAGIGRTIGLVWRASETRASDLRTVARFLHDRAPSGTIPATGGGRVDAATGA